MAVVGFTKGWRIHTAAGTIDNPTVGSPNLSGRYICHVQAISIVATAAGTTTTIRTDGAAGVIIYSVAPAAAGTVVLVYDGVEMGDLSVSALGTNQEVLVHLK